MMFRILNFRSGNIVSTLLVRNEILFNQNRFITSKKYRVKKNKPAPFPYEKYRYNTFWSMVDHTFKRFDENTKLIVVDGPVASGKHELAKCLADEFEMLYVPDITMDAHYINNYGYDMRNLDPKLPESCQSFDEENFCRDPTHFNAAAFQAIKYRLRWTHHWTILNHILNTGQGVVTVRSPFSTGVFTNAMRRCNYISEAAKYTYNEIVRHTIFYLYRPHLIIYLDVSVDKTIENIKKRNREAEVNGRALNRNYLQCMENSYKDVYLPEASIHSKILHFDWLEGGDPEIVIEDIERIDFKQYEIEIEEAETKLTDWRLEEHEMDTDRKRFSCDLEAYLTRFSGVTIYDAPEMWISGKDSEIMEKVTKTAPGMKWNYGYNADLGDNIWFNNKLQQSFTRLR